MSQPNSPLCCVDPVRRQASVPPRRSSPSRPNPWEPIVKLIDRLPETTLRSRGLQWGLLAAGPITVSGIMWLANVITGTAFAPGCGIAGVLLDAALESGARNLFGGLPPSRTIAAAPSECPSVPVSADLPNMVLSVTAGLAVSIFVVFNLRLRLLQGDLQTSGLVSTTSLDRSALGTSLAPDRSGRSRDKVLASILDGILAVVSI